MGAIRLSRTGSALKGTIKLNGSKSISNRALIALALAKANSDDWLSNLSDSSDTRVLSDLLSQDGNTYDAGDAGTSFRFLTAFLAIQPGTQILTGSARMHERPIGPLVTALRDLGANIEYLDKEGYPPLKIGEQGDFLRFGNRVNLPANISSQFLSALLLIAPYLPNGIEIVPEGKLVSEPYLDMTIKLMQHFGVEVVRVGNTFKVNPGGYTPRQLHIESDWSAASYWYAVGALSDELDLILEGLHKDSWQGDSALPALMKRFGIHSKFEGQMLHLRKSGEPHRKFLEYDFTGNPDLAQTMAVVCAGTGTMGLFSGLETLSIKETNRIAALKTELKKCGVSFIKLPAHMNKRSPDKIFYQVQGKASWEGVLRIATHGDHRMAMAFAPLAILGDVEIENPEVVKKSYPDFWEDMARLGFGISEIS
ncbi:MAG: 3-phosphoshikimate 1-carboxyvinyltransferase [Lewinellaceae bacterium]|nr:3-phosphoshikimate 1-carboxyvinyltransferase [Saprospiraceae bacterium]MCB9344774.1 3-phosphoshikimate 1-carboxyvinyltransferase [Lewinellaceae bacterium]